MRHLGGSSGGSIENVVSYESSEVNVISFKRLKVICFINSPNLIIPLNIVKLISCFLHKDYPIGRKRKAS